MPWWMDIWYVPASVWGVWWRVRRGGVQRGGVRRGGSPAWWGSGMVGVLCGGGPVWWGSSVAGGPAVERSQRWHLLVRVGGASAHRTLRPAPESTFLLVIEDESLQVSRSRMNAYEYYY